MFSGNFTQNTFVQKSLVRPLPLGEFPKANTLQQSAALLIL